MKKIGLLSLALLIALCSLGVAYSSWSAPLAIGGNLGTATYPTVTTEAVTNFVGTTTATLNGTLGSKGSATYVNAYFDYGLTNGYGSTTTLQTNIPTGAFSAAITGLTSGTLYHFRANAIGGDGTKLAGLIKNGGDMMFTTLQTAEFTTAGTPTGDVWNGGAPNSSTLPGGGSYPTQTLIISVITAANSGSNKSATVTYSIRNNSSAAIRCTGVWVTPQDSKINSIDFSGGPLNGTTTIPANGGISSGILQIKWSNRNHQTLNATIAFTTGP